MVEAHRLRKTQSQEGKAVKSIAEESMIYKRSNIYWYKFMWQGRLIRESTKQGNDKVARKMESAHRTSLAMGLVGIREKKAVPSLRTFCDDRFEPWAKTTFEESAWKNWEWYRVGVRALLSCRKIADLPLNEITGESTSEFASYRLSQQLQIATVNSSLRVLRSVLHRAVEWGVILAAPKIKLLPGERRRERVVTQEEEALYLAACREPLASVATVLADTGMRSEECFRLQWESISWSSGRYGTVLITHGKTAAARRVIPMTPRVRSTMEALWLLAKKPTEGWCWPAETLSGHIEPSSVRKAHIAAFDAVAKEAVKHDRKPIRPFVLYSFRHTFLTRLAEGGCDAWTLAKVAGHSSIAISSRYVHPGEDAVLNAISRLGGHKIGHTDELAKTSEHPGRLLTQ
jgi:integrase